MKRAIVLLLVLATAAISTGAGFVAGRITITHDDPNSDPYKYCFKVNTAQLPPQFRFALPNGTYAVCRIG